MTKMCNKNVIFKCGVMLYMITAVWVLLLAEDRFHTAVSFFHKIEKETEEEGITSTKYRFEQKFQKTLRQ